MMVKQQKTAGSAGVEKAAGIAKVLSAAELGLPAQKEKVSPEGFSIWVRALMQNWRQGTVACKDRSEVAFSNKKPWKQKGTGRARAGSARSPLWRGGGVIFGPQERTRMLKVTRKMKKDVLAALVQEFCDAGKLMQLDWKPQENLPKTTHAFKALKSAGLHEAPVTLFVPFDDMVTYTSFSNIPTVRMVFMDQANAFDLAASRYWVVLKKDMEQFKDTVGKWI